MMLLTQSYEWDWFNVEERKLRRGSGGRQGGERGEVGEKMDGSCWRRCHTEKKKRKELIEFLDAIVHFCHLTRLLPPASSSAT